MAVSTATSNEVIAVTPSDSTNLTKLARALYIGGTGNVALHTPNGGPVTFTNTQAGTVLPVQVVRVDSTGTTATNIVALV